uniref:SAM-dependent methyltransferase n=1 Tax=Pyricularia oryzae (strain P131) TaxID=1143193 RepID=L7J2B5_PYRO1
MTENTIPASMAGRIASYSITPPSAPDIEIAQAEHRITLINRWGIGPGHRVLEIGCGQGNTTAVLAEAVGETGSVDAVDPAPPDYGAPFTLAQAQAHISASAVGDRVTWQNADPVAFLRSGSATATWDVAVLAHSVWYFASSAVLAETLRALRGRAARLPIPWQVAGSWQVLGPARGSAIGQLEVWQQFKPLKAQCFNPVHYPWQAKGKKQLSHPSLPVVYPDPGARNTISAQGSFSWLDADPAVKHANCHKDTRAARYSVPTAHAVVDIQLLVAVDLANRPAQQTQGTA